MTISQPSTACILCWPITNMHEAILLQNESRTLRIHDSRTLFCCDELYKIFENMYAWVTKLTYASKKNCEIIFEVHGCITYKYVSSSHELLFNLILESRTSIESQKCTAV